VAVVAAAADVQVAVVVVPAAVLVAVKVNLRAHPGVGASLVAVLASRAVNAPRDL
jgi:hypothetical protein